MQLQRQEMQNWAIDIVTNCHFGSALPDCPCSEIRKLPIIERIAVVEKLSDQELEKLLNYHWKCSSERGPK
jgi:hypothetical protein